MPEDEQGWRPPRQGGATSAAPQPGGMHTPAPVLRRRRRMRLLAWGAVLAALILLAGGLWWAIPPLRCGDLTNGVRRVDGECVGVTDGSFVFDPAFREVQEDIVAENAWAAKKAAEEDVPLVKVALLATLTPTDSSAMTHEQVLGALEGAYVALHRANHTPELRDSRPFVQLYLANEGSRQQQWEIPVNQITGMTDDDVPLVAVFGQSISTDRTEQAARRLSQAEIPVITGSTTADSLDHDNIEGLIRTAPNNTDFATALDRYVDDHNDLDTAMMVFDRVKADIFVSSLRDAYQEKLGEDHIDFPDQPFAGDTIKEGGVDVFYPITQNICDAQPDMVLFAGRARDLRVFLEALSERSCRNDPISVLYGEVGLFPWTDDETMTLLEIGNITLLSAAGTDPRWARNEVPAQRDSPSSTPPTASW